jgi:DNA-binding NtrC family response regulator
MLILICDDEQSIIDTLEFAINCSGQEISVDSCTSIEEFLLAVQSKSYEVAILDLNMPNLGEVKIRSALEKIPDRTRIFVITGDSHFKLDGHRATVVEKPFPIDEFINDITSKVSE